MRLTRHADYALRTLMYLGVQGEARATIEQIATAHRISRNHLMKVVNRLAALGYVEAVRGRGGGLRLAKAPDAISVGAVVRAMEDNFELVECFAPTGNTCVITPACGLKRLLGEAVQAFLAVLDRHTLADLLGRPKALARLLALA